MLSISYPLVESILSMEYESSLSDPLLNLNGMPKIGQLIGNVKLFNSEIVRLNGILRDLADCFNLL